MTDVKDPAREPCVKCRKPVGQKIVLGCYGHPHFAVDIPKPEFDLADKRLKTENTRLRRGFQVIIDDVPRAIDARALQAWMKKIKSLAQDILDGKEIT